MEKEKQRKKLLILALLEILREKSDQEHPMRQKDMMTALSRDYGLTATRKSVGTNVQELVNSGYPIEHNGSGWYYAHEFSMPELDMLINAVICNGAIPLGQQNDMTKKLCNLGSRFYKPLSGGNLQRAINPSFFLNMELLHEAIEKGCQVAFHYVSYDVDKQLHPRLEEDGSVKEYVCNPYHVVVSEGKTYLICNKTNYDNLIHFRVDHLQDIRVLDTPCRPLNEIETDSHYAPDSPEYVMTHTKMYTGHVGRFRIHARRSLAAKILEQFGMGVEFENVTDQQMEAIIETDELSLKKTLSTYGDEAFLIGEETSIDLASENAVDSEVSGAASEKPRRRRGRPRKNPNLMPAGEAPKRRGRKPQKPREV